MATFLELCQTLGQECGVVDDPTLPASVTGNTDDLNDLVRFVRDAWVYVQNLRPDWLWMRREWQGTLSIGNLKYTAAALGITDLARWYGDVRDQGYFPTTIYDPAIGVADETAIRQVDYDKWRTVYGRGAQTADRPTVYAISPAYEICFGPKPDKAYVARGEYGKTAQVLTNNSDVPELPLRFHDIILRRAQILYAALDEAANMSVTATGEYTRILSDLERDQLPKPWFGARPVA